MSDEKVIPFRPRPRVVSEGELDAYRRMTRQWHPDMQRLVFPEYASRDQTSRRREED
jgi:hypothetical protein